MTGEREDPLGLVFQREQVRPVSGLEAERARGKRGLTVSHHGDGHVVPVGEIAGELGDALPHDGCALLDSDPDEQHPAPREGSDVGGASEPQEVERFPGTLPFRVDHQIDPHLISRKHAARREILRIRDSRHGVGDAHAVSRQGGNEVGLIATRNGQKHAGRADSRLFQHGERRSIAGHGEDVEVIGNEVEPLRVRVDQRDVVILVGQASGQIVSHLSGSCDDDLHDV